MGQYLATSNNTALKTVPVYKVTSAVNLDEYYKKTETYSQQEINEKLKTKQNSGNYITADQLTVQLNNKVDKDGNKVLSDNNFTTELMNKITTSESNISSINTILENKVDGKQLSDRNFTQVLETQIGTNQSAITEINNRVITDMEVNTDVSKIPTDGAVRAYTQAEIAKFDFIKVVSELPTPEKALPNRIYMVPKATQPLAIDPSTQKDLFDEYIWVQDTSGSFYWEFVGTKSVEVDLTDYYNKSQCDNTFLPKDGIDVAKLKALLNSIATVNGTVKFNKEIEAPSFNDIP